MSEPFSFDFSKDTVAQRAAENVTAAHVTSLLRQLEEANGLWGAGADSQRAAALASLQAVNNFLAANVEDATNRFSRPLRILALELANSPRPQRGNILAVGNSRQAADRHRRAVVNYLKAAAAFTAGAMPPLARGLVDTAAVMRAYRFPQSEFTETARSQTTPRAKAAKLARLAQQIKEWRKECRAGGSKASVFYKQLLAAPPFNNSPRLGESNALEWLQREFERAGYVAE